MIQRIVRENILGWEQMVESLLNRNAQIRIDNENSTTNLFEFNQALAHLHDEVAPHYYRARAFKDALDKLIDRTIKGQLEGKNEGARRAAGIHACQFFLIGNTQYNLFDYLDQWNHIELLLEGLMKSIKFKADAKITNNSLLNLERGLVR